MQCRQRVGSVGNISPALGTTLGTKKTMVEKMKTMVGTKKTMVIRIITMVEKNVPSLGTGKNLNHPLPTLAAGAYTHHWCLHAVSS